MKVKQILHDIKNQSTLMNRINKRDMGFPLQLAIKGKQTYNYSALFKMKIFMHVL